MKITFKVRLKGFIYFILKLFGHKHKPVKTTKIVEPVRELKPITKTEMKTLKKNLRRPRSMTPGEHSIYYGQGYKAFERYKLSLNG